MRIDRIVVGIDFSWPSITALQWVSRELAPDAEVVLVHALEIPEPPGILREPGATDTLAEVATEGARRRLDAAANTLAREHSSCLVRRGAPEDVLAAVAEELDADLVVAGPHRRRHGLWERRDTTVERLVARSTVPVLLIPVTPPARPAHVLVPTEEATVKSATGAWAEAMAERLGARLTRLTVVGAAVPSHLLGTVPMAGAAGEWAPYPEPGGRGGWIDALLDTSDDDGVPERETTFGEPGQEIIATAERYASLIVMGRQRAGNLRRAFVGSVTREVLRGATTPVLVVPEPD